MRTRWVVSGEGECVELSTTRDEKHEENLYDRCACLFVDRLRGCGGCGGGVIAMARRRVLALGPAMSRMICMSHPYQQIRRSDDSSSKKPKRTWLWRRKKSSTVKKMRAGAEQPRRRWGLRVGRLRIRLLSPLALLKRMCDAYVRMMFSLENKMGSAGLQCAAGPSFPIYPVHMPGRMATPDFAVKVKVN